MTGRLRYDRFGWDYARFNPLEARAVAWYLLHARSPVPELACGTGRLLAALAHAGHEVVGLDRSPTMLVQARQRLGDRATVVEGDMRAFELDRRFGLAFVADNSLRELETEADIVACLRCLHRHLEPDGRLLVTERRFDPSRYADGVAEHAWFPAGEDPGTGAPLERKVRVRLASDHKRLHGVMTYRAVAASDETELPVESLILRPDDYRRLFSQAGFDNALRVGYEEQADDGVDPILCFVCTPRR